MLLLELASVKSLLCSNMTLQQHEKVKIEVLPLLLLGPNPDPDPDPLQ
jgi:hypothetical protein